MTNPAQPELVEYELGAAAYDWIRYALDQRIAMGRPLSTALLSQFEVSAPEVSTYLPAGVDQASLLQFKWGGKLPPVGEPIRYEGGKISSTGEPVPFPGSGVMVPVPNLDIFLEGIVRDFLEESPRNLILVELGLVEAKDAWVQNADPPVLVVGGSVYDFANSASSDKAVMSAVRGTQCVYPPGIGILTTLDEGLPPFSGVTQVNVEVIDQLVARASLVLIGAYDGEGVLFWRPPLSQATSSP